MGSTNSTPRSVTIENDSPLGVIEVSDDVVQRLKVGLSKADAKEEKRALPSTPPSATPTPPPALVREPPQPRPVPVARPLPSIPQPPPQSSFAPPPPRSQPSSYQYYPEPTITSYDVLKQKDNELRNNDLYWKQRLAELEKQYQKQNTIVQEEFTKTYDSVKKQFERSSPLASDPLSTGPRDKLITCLEANLNEPLNCSGIAEEFTQSVLNSGHRRANSKAKENLTQQG